MVYRYGREDDEIIPGLSFMKELVIDRVQVYPEYQEEETTQFQVITLKIWIHTVQKIEESL